MKSKFHAIKTIAALLFFVLITSACSQKIETATTDTFEISKLNEYPLFEMRYFDDYRQGGFALEDPTADTFACSVFAASNPKGGFLMGRNFDWEHNPILILHTSPPEGYRSISVVNLGFIGIGEKQAENLISKIEIYKNKLSQVPFTPVDGMNEKGVSVGMAMVPEGRDDSHADKPMMGSLGIMREILDYAADVDEALEIMDSYRIEFGGGPAVHYLITDASGDSAVVEYGSGQMHVIRKEREWQAITNFLLETAGSEPEQYCDRFRKISETLTASKGKVSIKEGIRLLSNVSQGDPMIEGTQWSALYDLASLKLNLAIGKDYSHTYTIVLD